MTKLGVVNEFELKYYILCVIVSFAIATSQSRGGAIMALHSEGACALEILGCVVLQDRQCISESGDVRTLVLWETCFEAAVLAALLIHLIKQVKLLH